MQVLGWREREHGFTVIEIVIVVAVLAILGAIAIPNVTGFLSRGKSQAFENDQRILQAAVDRWRTDIQQRPGNPWPTVGGVKGNPADSGDDGVDIGTDSTTIKVSTLVTDGSLSSTDTVKSFAYSKGTGTGATNSPAGSYMWYVDTNGKVQAKKWTDSDDDDIVDLGELAAQTGFQTGVYP